MDLNHDKQIQSLLCYRYTIGQAGATSSLNRTFWKSSKRSFFNVLLAVSGLLAFSLNVNAADQKSKAGTLLVSVLSIESSYAKNIERPATDYFDTVQWWAGESGDWWTTTFAIDADIHPHKIEPKSSALEFIKMAKDVSQKDYGDVTRRVVEIDVPAGLTNEELGKLLKKQGLSENFEWVDAGYLFWKPDLRHYFTQTKPTY